MPHKRPGRSAYLRRQQRAQITLDASAEERLLWAIFGDPPPIKMPPEKFDFYNSIDENGDVTINGDTLIAGVDF